MMNKFLEGKLRKQLLISIVLGVFLLFFVQSCQSTPEKERIALEELKTDRDQVMQKIPPREIDVEILIDAGESSSDNTGTPTMPDKQWGSLQLGTISDVPDMGGFGTGGFSDTGFGAVKLVWEAPEDENRIGYQLYRRQKMEKSGDSLAGELVLDGEESVGAGYRQPQVISVDGELSDWNWLKPVNSYPYPPEDPLHIKDIWVTHDKEFLYLYILNASNIQDAAIITFFIDLDKNYSTGSGSKNWRGLPIGAEVCYYYNHPDTVYRKVWDQDWAGPYPYEEFVSGNYADPQYAWKDPFDMTWVGLAKVGASGVINNGAYLDHDGWEMKIPFAELSSIAGYEIDPDCFGADFFFSTNFDQFPTVGYGPGSPLYYSYGYEKLYETSSLHTSYVDDTALDGITYEYMVFSIDADGNREPILENPVVLERKRAQVYDFNTAIIDSSSLGLSLTFPDNDAIKEAVVVRSRQDYPETLADGIVAAKIPYRKSGTVSLIDTNLEAGESYYYSVFSLSDEGEITTPNWAAKDRSIPAIIREPIPDFNELNDYMVYFSSWDSARVEAAKKYSLVILHPGGGSQLITRKQVDEIQRGQDGIKGTADDVLVVGYVSIGEDFGINPDIIQKNTENGLSPNTADYPVGPWSIKGYNYPRKSQIDTAGPVFFSYGTSSMYESNAEDPIYQFPSYYVDMIDYSGQGGAGQDGLPDQNIEWGGLFVDPGNVYWQEFIRTARIDTDYVAGIDWVLGLSDGGLGCDGVFLDTVGVSATWSQWFPFTFYGDYFWTRDGALDFIAKIGLWYPEAIIIPNRPMHFVFEDFIGSRYDDFRSLVNAIFWESYAADVEFWWGGTYADIFEEAVISSQKNSDNRGFTTLTLDYWNVMMDGEEGGEFQRAPWYDHISEYIEKARSSGFVPYITDSRSLADTADYVYYYEHPEKRSAPDLFVQSILEKQVTEQAVDLEVIITNQGADVLETQKIPIKIFKNDEMIEELTLEGLQHLEQYKFPLTIELSPVGTLVTVQIDPDNSIQELDEITAGSESNNKKSRYIERYASPREGWFPDGFAPDVTVSKIAFLESCLIAGEPCEVRIFYTNASDAGVAPDTRMYLWIGDALPEPELRNIKVPFLMPGETVEITVPFTPRVPGFISVGAVADGNAKVMELNEFNNTASASAFVYGSLNGTPYIDWKQKGVVGPVLDSAAEILAPSADLISSSIFADDTYLYIRMEIAGDVNPSAYLYLVFIDADGESRTGYSINNTGADFHIMNGSLRRYTGNGSTWSWESAGELSSIDMRKDTTHKILEYRVKRSVLDMSRESAEPQYSVIVTISDQDNATVDDVSKVMLYPPVGGEIKIDGKDYDWQDMTESLVVHDGLMDGYNAQGQSVGAEIGAFADVNRIDIARDAEYVYGKISTQGAIQEASHSWAMYIDLDEDVSTGYGVNWGTVGADYMLLDGVLYLWNGKTSSEWSWFPLEDTGVVAAVGLETGAFVEFAVPRASLEWFTDVPITLYFQSIDKQKSGWEDDISDSIPEFGTGGVSFPEPLVLE